MTRRASITEPSARQLFECLVDVRDEILNAKNLMEASYMAVQALGPGSSERSALCAVTNAARETLETVIQRLDQVIAVQS